MPQEISSLTRSLARSLSSYLCIGIDLIRMHCSASGVPLQTAARAKCSADAPRLAHVMSANCVVRDEEEKRDGLLLPFHLPLEKGILSLS